MSPCVFPFTQRLHLFFLIFDLVRRYFTTDYQSEIMEEWLDFESYPAALLGDAKFILTRFFQSQVFREPNLGSGDLSSAAAGFRLDAEQHAFLFPFQVNTCWWSFVLNPC